MGNESKPTQGWNEAKPPGLNLLIQEPTGSSFSPYEPAYRYRAATPSELIEAALPHIRERLESGVSVLRDLVDHGMHPRLPAHDGAEAVIEAVLRVLEGQKP